MFKVLPFDQNISETVCAVIQSGCQMLLLRYSIKVACCWVGLLEVNVHSIYCCLQRAIYPSNVQTTKRSPRDQCFLFYSPSTHTHTHSIIHSSELCFFRGGRCLCTRGANTSDRKRKGEVFKFAVKECFEEFIEGSCIFSNDQVRYKYRISHPKRLKPFDI